MREIVKHPGAVVILPITDDNYVYMVRQYRKPVEEELIELPAGKLEQDEDPIETAKRELKEELSLEALEWTRLTFTYSSPGFTDEKMYFFLAKGLKESYGEADEDEIIEPEKLRLDELYNKISQGEIKDGKTVLALMYYKNFYA